MWPYDEMDDPTAEQRDDEAEREEREEREEAARDRADEHTPAPSLMGNACPVFGLVCDGAIGGSGRCCRQSTPRVVKEEIPPGEGDPVMEFYRALSGAKSVQSWRVEWEPMSDDAIRGGNDPF